MRQSGYTQNARSHSCDWTTDESGRCGRPAVYASIGGGGHYCEEHAGVVEKKDEGTYGID